MPSELQHAATSRNLLIPDRPSPLDASTSGLAPDQLIVLGGRGVVVGRLHDLGGGRWVAVPGVFPAAIGTAYECLDFLVEFTHCQTFPVVVRFTTPQMAHFKKNETFVLDAVKKAGRNLVGGVVDGVVVGTACSKV